MLTFYTNTWYTHRKGPNETVAFEVAEESLHKFSVDGPIDPKDSRQFTVDALHALSMDVPFETDEYLIVTGSFDASLLAHPGHMATYNRLWAAAVVDDEPYTHLLAVWDKTTQELTVMSLGAYAELVKDNS